ncbi:MAG: hypothetical protein ABW185_25195 [Sedimenticola sp.]
MLKRKIYLPVLLFSFSLLVTQIANAESVRFNFTGMINTTSGSYNYGELFSGFYIIDSETSGAESTAMHSSGDLITSTTYANAVTAFQMIFSNKSIMFSPDGISNSSGSDSSVKVMNDQRFTTYSGSHYYSDRLITTINDQSASVGQVDFVQFDWSESSFTGTQPDLLTSSDLPLVATDYSVSYNQGRISADRNQNIFFKLTSLEVVPVPLPSAFFLFGSALIGLTGLGRRLKKDKEG